MKKWKKPHKYPVLVGEERTKSNAIRCAVHYHNIGARQIGGGVKKPDFKRMSIPELKDWIAVVTEGLGIQHFGKYKA